MTHWALALLVPIGALALVFFTYQGCTTILKIEKVLPRWATQHGFRILNKESRTHFQGPFGYRRRSHVYKITIEDQAHRLRTGWISLGGWYLIGFHEHIEVIWDDESDA